MLFEIKHRITGSALFSLECGSLKLCVEAAVKAKADLSGSNLRGSNLSYSNLRGSNLSYSDLSGSDLSGSDLSGSDLLPIRADFYEVLSHAPAEVPALISALELGRVNGSTYSDGECGCLVGTLAIASGADPANSPCTRVHDLNGDGSRPIERFFMNIRRGDTPATNQVSCIARDWAREWLDRITAAFSASKETVQP